MKHVDVLQAIRRADLPSPQIVILFALASRMMTSNECWPSMKTLAGDTGLSLSAIEKHIPLLRQSGWLDVRRFSNETGPHNAYSWGDTLSGRVSIPHDVGEAPPTTKGLKVKGKEKQESKTCGTAAGGVVVKCSDMQGKVVNLDRNPTLKNLGEIFIRAKADYTETFCTPLPRSEVVKLKAFQQFGSVALKCIFETVRRWNKFGEFLHETTGVKTHPDRPSVGWLVRFRAEALEFATQAKPQRTQEELEALAAQHQAKHGGTLIAALAHVKEFS